MIIIMASKGKKGCVGKKGLKGREKAKEGGDERASLIHSVPTFPMTQDHVTFTQAAV